MTFNVGHVAGGSHAGWKIQKPAPKPWRCNCPGPRKGYRDPVVADWRSQPAYMSRCIDCGTRRP